MENILNSECIPIRKLIKNTFFRKHGLGSVDQKSNDRCYFKFDYFVFALSSLKQLNLN